MTIGAMNRQAHFSSPARGPRGRPPRMRLNRRPIQPEPYEGRRASSVIGAIPVASGGGRRGSANAHWLSARIWFNWSLTAAIASLAVLFGG